MLLGSGLEYRNEDGNQRSGAEQTDRRTDQAVLLRRGTNSLSIAYNAGLADRNLELGRADL